MVASRDTKRLIRWCGILAAGGSLILLAGAVFLATALWHIRLAGDGPSFVVVAPGPTAILALTSVVVLAAAVAAWRQARQAGASLARRLSLSAIITTVTAWAAVGVAFLALTRGS